MTDLNSCMQKCQELMAHAWVVRAFLRHSDEIEDFPELTEICRAIFDLSRALETRVDDPVSYFKMLNKKLPKFRVAAEQYAKDVPEIATHTNFAQSVISINVCVRELFTILETAREIAKNNA